MALVGGIRCCPRIFPSLAKYSGTTRYLRLHSTSSSLPQQDVTSEVKARRPEPAEADSMMDIGIRNIFNEDHDILRRSIRKFIQDEIKPQHREWELRGYADPGIFKTCCDAGMSCLSWPEEEYGQGGTLLDASIFWDEIMYANVSVANGMGMNWDIIAPYLVHYGSPEQKVKYLKGIAKDGMIAALGMTEPDTGSDLQGIKTYAKRDGDDWILNGSKMFITNGHFCDFVLVVAKTNPDAKTPAQGLTMFIVDADTPGFTKGPLLRKLGLTASDTSALYFDDVRVPSTAVLGEVNKGFIYLMRMLPYERIGVASAFTGLAEFMFEETRNYVRQRKAFGKHLSNLQVIQHKLAEMKTNICTTRAFVDQCLQAGAEGQLDPNLASMAKYWATDVSLKVGNDCVQLHGGTGYMEESEICRAYTWARVGPIYGGTNEIMKELISRKIVKG